MRPTLLQERPPGKTQESVRPVEELRRDLLGVSADASVDLPPPPPSPVPPPPESHGERPVCDLCAKSFASQKTLKRHRETVHRQSSGFLCRVCDRRFYRREHLKNHHIRKHADEEYEAPASYCCPVCQKKLPLPRPFERTSRPTQPPLHRRPPLLLVHGRQQRRVCAPTHKCVRPSYWTACPRIVVSAIGTIGLRSGQVNGATGGGQ